MRLARLIAGLMALLLCLMPGIAVAGLLVTGPTVRVPVIGTPFSVALPAGFALAHDRYGVLTDDNVDALVLGEPNDRQAQAALQTTQSALSALLFKWMGKLGIGNKVETVQSGGKKFLLLSNSSAKQSVHFEWWRVMPLEHPDASITFVQVDGRQHMFDRNTVLQAIATLKPSREGTVKGGVYVAGLFVPAIPPFIWTSMTLSAEDGGKGVQLSALGAGSGATLNLTFPSSSAKSPINDSFDAYLWSIAAARFAPLSDAVLEDAQRTSLGGFDAVRSRVADDGRDTIEYVASSGGYPIILTAKCDCKAITPELVDTIDEIARSIRPQTQEELAGAQP